MEIDDAWLEEIRSAVGELPAAMKQRFMTDYQLNDYDAGGADGRTHHGGVFRSGCGGRGAGQADGESHYAIGPQNSQ